MFSESDHYVKRKLVKNNDDTVYTDIDMISIIDNMFKLVE